MTTDWLQIGLLVLLALIQLSRWSQKVESSPDSILRRVDEAKRKANDALERANSVHHKLNNHLHNHTHELDQIYVRRETHIAEHQVLDFKLRNAEARIERIEEVAT